MKSRKQKSNFDEQMERIQFATRMYTQVDLADFFGIKESGISEAQKLGKIPADWLTIILQVKGILPEWILTGNGPCHIVKPTPPEQYETGDIVQKQLAKKDALRSLSSRDLADELLRRIAVSQFDVFTR